MAQRAVQRIYAATRALKRFSQIGRIVPELGDESLREIFWKSYRIVYWVKGDSITIVTVFHDSREFTLEEGEEQA